jgi:hypothetical protein
MEQSPLVGNGVQQIFILVPGQPGQAAQRQAVDLGIHQPQRAEQPDIAVGIARSDSIIQRNGDRLELAGHAGAGE